MAIICKIEKSAWFIALINVPEMVQGLSHHMVAAHGSFTHAARRNRPLVEAFMQPAIDTARVENARSAR